MRSPRKHPTISLPIFLLGLLLIGRGTTAAPELTVYAYDSFTAKGSLGAYLKDSFEKATGAGTKFVSFGSAGEALNQIAVEGKSTKADLLIGVDGSLAARAKAMGAFTPNDIKAFPQITPELWLDRDRELIPFDYGLVAIVYDGARTSENLLPRSLKDLAKSPSFKKKLAIEDPRSSSIGLTFLMWTHALFKGAELDAFWKDLRGQVLTVSPGWSGAYGLFAKKQADLVVSYSTSPAYHIENEKGSQVRALLFPEGHLRQVEAVAMVKYSKKAELARKWVAHLLSPQVQAKLPSLQWMYPAAKGTPLPESFRGLPVPKALEMEPLIVEASKKEWIRRWTELMSQSG